MMMDTTRVYEVKHRKPHTKLQQRCFDLAKKLPALTEAQRRWGRGKMQPIGYYVKRGHGGKHSAVWCQECGMMEEVQLPPLYMDVCKPKHVCCRCGRRLELSSWSGSRKDVEQNFNFAVVTAIEDMQVVRVFNIHQYNAMGSDTVEHTTEVYQVWLDGKTLKETILSRPYTRSFYHFRWSMTEPMKVAHHNGSTTGYVAYNDTYDVSGLYIYPRAKVLPILKRNGWTTQMLKMKASQVDVWSGLLTDPAVEGLAKTGQLDVLDYWFRTGGWRKDKSQWLPMVKICNRRKYIIKDASMWFDLLDMLRELGKDTHSPKYICPDDLQAMHDLMQRRIDRKHEREEIAKLNSQAKNWEEYYKENKGAFFGVAFDNGNIFCHVVGSVAEMLEEGAKMHHCVYKMGYYKKPESLILSARDRWGNRLETVEVNLKRFQVIQSRGLQNNPTSAHGDIVALVEKNMNLIRKAATRQISIK